MKAKIIKFTDTNKKPFATKYIYIFIPPSSTSRQVEREIEGKYICVLRSRCARPVLPRTSPRASRGISPRVSLICDQITPGLLTKWLFLYVGENKKRLSSVLQTVNVPLRRKVLAFPFSSSPITRLNEVYLAPFPSTNPYLPQVL